MSVPLMCALGIFGIGTTVVGGLVFHISPLIDDETSKTYHVLGIVMIFFGIAMMIIFSATFYDKFLDDTTIADATEQVESSSAIVDEQVESSSTTAGSTGLESPTPHSSIEHDPASTTTVNSQVVTIAYADLNGNYTTQNVTITDQKYYPRSADCYYYPDDGSKIQTTSGGRLIWENKDGDILVDTSSYTITAVA